MLRFRRGECDLLDRLLDDVGSGESRALVLRGEAGIGKTVLLEYAFERAAEWRSVRASGVESERELAFAGLHQVCAPALDSLGALPAPQQQALRTAFGLAPGTPPDRFVVGLAVLGLLGERARDRPLLCLIDDAQWLDRASAQVLGFVARRLRAESVAMIFAVREPTAGGEVTELSGLPDVWVGGLSDEHARMLLASAYPGPADRGVLDRVVAESRGNPLALLELPRGFTRAELEGWFGSFSQVVLPGRIEESFLRQIGTLSPVTRQVLLVAAAEPVGDPVLVWRAVDRLGVTVDVELASREAAGRFVDFGARVRFRHPLLRSAIYRAATAEERRRAHWALGQVTDPVADPDRRAWHRAQATEAPDEEVAAELDECARGAFARGAAAAAAAFLERAAELTPTAKRRGQRFLAAAHATYEGGMPAAAPRLIALAEASPLSALEEAQADVLYARSAFALGRGRDATESLFQAATRLQAIDARTARNTHLEAIRASWFLADHAPGLTLREMAEAAHRSPRPGPESTSDVLIHGLAIRYRDGYEAGAAVLKKAVAEFCVTAPTGEIGVLLEWFAGSIAVDLLDDESWDLISRRYEQRARDEERASLPIALTMQIVNLVMQGALAAAESLLEDFDAVRQATGIYDAPYAGLLWAVWRGRDKQATEMLDAMTNDAVERGEGVTLIAAEWLRATLLNSLGRYREAATAGLRATESEREMGFTTLYALVELVTAAAHTGQSGTAARALARLTTMTEASGTDWAHGVTARCRAMVADHDSAELDFHEALTRLGRTRIRAELARTHLHYGEWLRRRGRSKDARRELRTAHSMLTDMGMASFAALAARELRATGEKVREGPIAPSSTLTPQETQIVRLVREGLSNAEIADRLFISPRTVEWHLGKVFGKLGVTSRRQLRR
ncbi:LuxR family transcriptional regulator [Nocardioides sp. YIM 152315]|uniref:helix-turn-helix transcriptional regulator n=1 Tax=Nocardioides sp. YIM 152315 TaxID=3031760 RepID=UPI0023DA0E85|nr:LuxR family transcriptional regulator [Nocardioides sp. YIM 152315]MDF1603227.1 LuxR C-terminal-related transcriptional regulator [Nocardioides sp. YIM 152315]